ncbi:hypothetical protein BJY01DRAFT_225589 [Aspergillus pseudoustus]|uniref:Uncharacterized protein n=1 Tax=Aspergillus pseudoustus TaxID=1810923 RepID=A0ABR4IZM7_9EURO
MKRTRKVGKCTVISLRVIRSAMVEGLRLRSPEELRDFQRCAASAGCVNQYSSIGG